MSLPWDDLADAYEFLQHAERFGSAESILEAKEEVQRHRESCGLIGGLLLNLASEHAGAEVVKVFESIFGKHIDAINDRGRRAARSAKDAQDRIQALTDRVNHLERILDDVIARRELRVVG